MDFDEYQAETGATAIYPGEGTIEGLSYVTLGLVGEAGEIANKVKKLIRDGDGRRTLVQAEEIFAELGDVLWYCARLASELGVGGLDDAAIENVEKLRDRKERGVLGGSGDKR